MTSKPIYLLIISIACLLLQSCGFTPLYATSDGSNTPGLKNINLVSLTARDTIEPLVARAVEERQGIDFNSDAAEYDLSIEAEEFAQQLAVQIDASVTRYNYLLRAEYLLIRRADGEKFTGSAEAVSSFNVVNSQYSTLFAEEAARQKAARTLIKHLERDILLNLQDGYILQRPQEESRNKPDIELEETIIDERP